MQLLGLSDRCLQLLDSCEGYLKQQWWQEGKPWTRERVIEEAMEWLWEELERRPHKFLPKTGRP